MILIAILLIAGLATKQPRRYWLHAGAAVATQFVLGLLLAGYGTLENPAGDGIITRWVRAATNDGPLMGFWALIVIALGWGIPIYIAARGYVRRPARTKSEPPTPTETPTQP